MAAFHAAADFGGPLVGAFQLVVFLNVPEPAKGSILKGIFRPLQYCFVGREPAFDSLLDIVEQHAAQRVARARYIFEGAEPAFVILVEELRCRPSSSAARI